MNWDILVSYFFNAVLLPPGINLLLIVLGILGLKKYRRSSISVLFVAFASLFMLSMPWISNLLMDPLESYPAINTLQLKQLQPNNDQSRAIVVLSGGRLSLAPEYGDIDTVNAATLQRIKYASWLQKKTLLPVLLSGGSVFDEATSEAVLMNQTMLSSFGVAPKWIESKSKNTAENAIYASTILKQNNINEIVLITHAWHMPRAKLAFQKQGLVVIPAPMSFSGQKGKVTDFTNFLPSAKALYKSSLALHEMIGLFWYNIRY